MDAQKLGSFIRERRLEQGTSQKELAEQIHVTPQAVSKWERGLGIPDIENVVNLSTALNVSIAEIMQGRLEDKSNFNSQEVAELMNDTVQIVHEQTTTMRKIYLLRMLFLVLSLTLIFIGLHFLVSPYSQITLINDSTAFFVINKLPIWIPLTLIVSGIIILLFSNGKQLTLFMKRRKNEQAT